MADAAPADEPDPSAGSPDSVERPTWDLSPDEIVRGLQHEGGGPQDVSVLCGFLGESDAPGYHRLFTDPALKHWVDIPDDAIRYRHRVPDEQDGYGGRSVVWVANGAVLVRGAVTIAGAEADFLIGPWSAGACWQPCDQAVTYAKPVSAVAAASPAATSKGCCHY
jgi:hypothetical protein